jgi:hypothetical protein
MLHGRRSTWNLLLAAISLPIIGVDFLQHFQLMVDLARANMLVDKASLPSLTAASSPSPVAAEDPAALPTDVETRQRYIQRL